MRSFRSFLISYCLILFFTAEQEAFSLNIHLFSEKNGKGLEVDQKILAHFLENLGHEVSCFGLCEEVPSSFPVDINIFFQVINLARCSHATANWFIPNPEWYYQGLEELAAIDLILCRTKEVERIFQGLNKKTYLLGFTSRDCYRPDIPKNFSAFLHVAGTSDQKGTPAILSVWSRTPSFPPLTLIKHHSSSPFPEQENVHWIHYRLEEEALRELQNQCGIHLCLSETEGFGHYLMEAMSTGAVVITTDAPPMNEFMTDRRCLVPAFRSRPQCLGINYYVHAGSLKETLHRLRKLSLEDLQAIGRENREIYLKKTEEFKQRLVLLLKTRLCTF